MRAGRIDRFQRLLALAIAATIALALVAACGGETPADRQRAAERAMFERSRASVAAVAAAATAEPAATPTAATPATSGGSTSEASAANGATDGESDMDGPAGGAEQAHLIALGKQIYFEGGAGGTACQVCHGKDAMGLIGPPIIGKGVGDIELQLEINPAMQGLYPTQAQMKALAAYLQSLGPPVQAQQGP
jgi:mono/diheme cytochrome c family protein